MNQRELSELTDEQLLAEAKKIKSTSTINAGLIGVMIGVGIYSTVKNGFGFFTLVPVIFIIFLIKKSTDKKVLDRILKDRNL